MALNGRRTDRPRAEGRPTGKRPRPRDELGRPLAWDAENQLDLEDFDSLSLDENHRLGMEHWNAGRFFPSHEAWETCWKQARGSEDEEFFKGLSQLGAGYVHWRRGNPHGARTLLERGASRVRRYGPRHHGIDVESLVRRVADHAERFGRAERDGGPMPRVRPPKV